MDLESKINEFVEENSICAKAYKKRCIEGKEVGLNIRIKDFLIIYFYPKLLTIINVYTEEHQIIKGIKGKRTAFNVIKKILLQSKVED